MSRAPSTTSDASRVARPRALVATEPLTVNEVDDAAIWLHPTDPSLSLLVCSNEKRGLEVHDFDGTLLKHLDDGLRPNNVDVLYGFDLGGRSTDLLFTSCISDAAHGVRAYRVDVAKRKLVAAHAAAVLPVFDGAVPLGLCTYTSARTRKAYVFVTRSTGAIEQHEILARGEEVELRRVRTLSLASKTEGCVADAEAGVVYFAEEDGGVWCFDAEPDGTAQGRLVVRLGENGLIPDIEGLALYGASSRRGYLIVVSQGPKGGDSFLNVYERGGDHKFVLRVEPSAEGLGGLQRSAGVAVTNRPTSARFPEGVLAVNDHTNANASEDFKLYSWAELAREGGLIVDTEWSARDH